MCVQADDVDQAMPPRAPATNALTMAGDGKSLERIDGRLGRASEVGDDWSEWRGFAAQVLTAIAAIAGEKSDDYEAAQVWTSPADRPAAGVGATTAGLRALRSDVAKGYLKRRPTLLQRRSSVTFLTWPRT